MDQRKTIRIAKKYLNSIKDKFEIKDAFLFI